MVYFLDSIVSLSARRYSFGDCKSGNRCRDITRREREVGSLIALGLTNRQIGGRLELSENTIKRHVSGLMLKLMVFRRTQIAVFALIEDWTDAWTDDERNLKNKRS